MSSIYAHCANIFIYHSCNCLERLNSNWDSKSLRRQTSHNRSIYSFTISRDYRHLIIMRKKNDNAYHIEKLKRKKNWKSYYVDLKTILIKENYWKYAFDRVIASIKSIQSRENFVSKAIQNKYDQDLKEYVTKKKKFYDDHENAMSIMYLIIMFESREYIKNYKNSMTIINKLLKQYDISNLIIIDIFFQEICRSNMNEFKSINEYANHIQRHYNKILQVDKIIDT